MYSLKLKDSIIWFNLEELLSLEYLDNKLTLTFKDSLKKEYECNLNTASEIIQNITASGILDIDGEINHFENISFPFIPIEQPGPIKDSKINVLHHE